MATVLPVSRVSQITPWEPSYATPPYGIGFLGVVWDTYSGEDRDHVPRGDIQDKMGSVCHPHNSSEQAWTRGRENRAYGDFCLSWLQLAFGVLEPGGILKAFSGTRTFHRLAAAMVEAGFQDIRMEAWGYASGFPKSHNVSLFLDKSAGAVGNRGRAIPTASTHRPGKGKYGLEGQAKKLTSNPVEAYTPVTESARQWDGWGTALKPAWEPVIIGRKPS